jgi:protein-S-isoprenylcysteine O-methyltransferase Ste14
LVMTSWGLVVITAFSVVSFFGLAAWGWGGVEGLVGNPVRAWGLLVIGVAAGVSLFSGIHLGGCGRADAFGQWRLLPLSLISLGMAVVPAYCDRRGIGTIGGEFVRYLGLGLLLVGAIYRVGPMFVLGDRFTWPLASQPGHALLTNGFYRFVRHPSYAGALVGGIGWVLLFRSGWGLALVGLLFPFFLPVVWEEERLLEAEFGEAYRDYCGRTWRLVPFVY